MNLLETFLRRVISQQGLPLDGDALRFEQVLGVPDMAHAPNVGEALRAAAYDSALGDVFQNSYLSRVTQEDVRMAEQSAEPEGLADAPVAEEWVAVVEGPAGGAVTLPADSSSLTRLSLFANVDGSVGRVSAEVDAGGQLVGVSMSAARHCGFPDRLQCSVGACGTCRLALREVRQRGYVCVCPHQQ